jgi:hypothetical protein
VVDELIKRNEIFTMKNFLKIFGVAAMMVAFSCNENEDLITEDAKVGGLLTASSQSLNYVVGNPAGPYTVEFLVNQGKVGVREIRLYKSFTTNDKFIKIVDGEEVEADTTFTSNEVLDRTLTVEQDGYHFIDTDYTFEELKEGLLINSMDGPNNPLPAEDVEYKIGDRWNLRVVSVLDDGREVEQSYKVGISVSTRYAGQYKTVFGSYYRIGVQTYVTSDWPAVTTIESVDATTYRVVDYFGPFNGNEWYFQIDPNTLKISYPATKPDGSGQVGNGVPFISCATTPGAWDYSDFASCEDSDRVINDDEKGKDRLIMSFGYNAAAPRVFHHVLEKIVD